MKLSRVIALLLMAVLPGACTSQQPAETRVEAAQYTATFDAAKQVLRDLDFSLERVDAYSGVITTRPKSTAGLGTPWDHEQSTVGQEVEDVLDRQSRVARVTFDREGAPVESAASMPDKRSGISPLTMRVVVQVYRKQRPGWRLETSAVRHSTHSSDPELARAGMEPTYETLAGEDTLLAGRIAQEILAMAASKPVDHGSMAERRGEVPEGESP